ncbi:MAG: pyridoxamine 5'-phosphate oxidase family protein [Actinomycetota bacterium]
MAAWRKVKQLAPDLAVKIEARFEASGLGLLATIRRNGFPRITGIEPLFGDELWLGMMPNSRKAADLMANPRLALHAATEDKNVAKGDAKVSGEAQLMEDEAVLALFKQDFEAHTGQKIPVGPIHLFRVNVTEMSFLNPYKDHLLIEWWREGGEVQTVKRY